MLNQYRVVSLFLLLIAVAYLLVETWYVIALVNTLSAFTDISNLVDYESFGRGITATGLTISFFIGILIKPNTYKKRIGLIFIFITIGFWLIDYILNGWSWTSSFISLPYLYYGYLKLQYDDIDSYISLPFLSPLLFGIFYNSITLFVEQLPNIASSRQIFCVALGYHLREDVINNNFEIIKPWHNEDTFITVEEYQIGLSYLSLAPCLNGEIFKKSILSKTIKETVINTISNSDELSKKYQNLNLSASELVSKSSSLYNGYLRYRKKYHSGINIQKLDNKTHQILSKEGLPPSSIYAFLAISKHGGTNLSKSSFLDRLSRDITTYSWPEVKQLSDQNKEYEWKISVAKKYYEEQLTLLQTTKADTAMDTYRDALTPAFNAIIIPNIVITLSLASIILCISKIIQLALTILGLSLFRSIRLLFSPIIITLGLYYYSTNIPVSKTQEHLYSYNSNNYILKTFNIMLKYQFHAYIELSNKLNFWGVYPWLNLLTPEKESLYISQQHALFEIATKKYYYLTPISKSIALSSKRLMNFSAIKKEQLEQIEKISSYYQQRASKNSNDDKKRLNYFNNIAFLAKSRSIHH